MPRSEAAHRHIMTQGLELKLADGRQWVIHALDDKAATIVAELGEAMQLNPGRGGRELCVAVCEEHEQPERPDAEGDGPLVCQLDVPTDRNTQVLQMMRIASTVAPETLARGGLLLHSALAEYRGSGFVMAGPGTMGKSTASGRLPSPWHSLCDDMTLVVRDGNGRYHAHPWPTWSRFFFSGVGGSWAVERSVPLGQSSFWAGPRLTNWSR